MTGNTLHFQLRTATKNLFKPIIFIIYQVYLGTIFNKLKKNEEKKMAALAAALEATNCVGCSMVIYF